MSIDVLQIDTEGYDDIVVYNSNLSETRPKLIYFESQHMSPEKQMALNHYLLKHRYRIYKVGGDSLAICSHMSLTCIPLHIVVFVVSVIDLLLHRPNT